LRFVRWVDTLKQIGDVAVQYDPAHASLLWAGIWFYKLALVIEIKKYNVGITQVEGEQNTRPNRTLLPRLH
jgi:hypothetical protein